MGTNYYLIKKCSKEELSRYGHYNDDFRSDSEPKELTNGFLYRNTYYPTEEELLNNLALILHIGKSSYGWHFSLCIYPELGINDLDDWKKLFSEYEIYDEYDRLVSTDEMLETITNRYDKEFLELGQEAFEAKVVANHNELWNHMHTSQVKDYDEYLRINYAERGLNGLLAHKYHCQRTDGTYDITSDWNFC